MEARRVDAVEPRGGELWLTDEGGHVELDLVGDLNWPVPVRLDEEGVRGLRRALDVWLEGHEPAQQEMDLLPGQVAAVDAHGERQLADPDAQRLGPFAAGSETSRRAALEAYPRQGSQRWRILELFRGQWIVGKRREGWTRDELAGRLSVSPNTIRPRVVELVEGGWLEESEQTRPSAAGHASAVLVLSETAVEHFEKHMAYR